MGQRRGLRPGRLPCPRQSLEAHPAAAGGGFSGARAAAGRHGMPWMDATGMVDGDGGNVWKMYRKCI